MKRKQPNSSQPTKVDITDFIEVLCGCRKEAYPFEKYVALLTFSTWLNCPQDPRVVSQGKLVAAALVINAIQSGLLKLPNEQQQKAIDQIGSKVLEPNAVTDILVNRTLVGSYRDEFEFGLPALSDVSGIAAFFVRCPLELKPSLNKALFFIDAEGYVEGDSLENKVSPATLKKSWVKYAVVSPFIFSADYWEEYFIYTLAPDDTTSIKEATKLLKNEKRLNRFFGFALHVQQIMMQRLDRATLEWLKFIEFPKSIKPHVSRFYPFDPEQMEILKTYRAPKQI